MLLAGLTATSLSLAGCEAIEEKTGLGRETQIGALGGAATGGIIAGLAGANPAWIAASTVLGGVAGGAIGNYLGKQNAETHAANNLKALDTLGEGQSSSWQDPQSGNSGSTRVNRVTTAADGRTCKSYTETVRTSAKTVSEDATACRGSDGTWRVQSG
jgi:surface antigen